MCGLLGCIGEIDRHTFDGALARLKHRGPDDADVYHDVDVHFGHRRLSIVDLSSNARQPMSGHDGQLVAMFNGELYNYRPLRRTLEERGHRFSTASDTEVILHGYREWGEQALERFDGMFALAVYDKAARSVLLARDPLGIKPLYYAQTDGRFTFASEPKGILALDRGRRSLNLGAVSSYLSFRYPILDDSFFDGIVQLPAGCLMRVDTSGRAGTRRYWALAPFLAAQHEDRGEAWYVDRLDGLLATVVTDHMIADVPVGAYLSGGVDSSAVVAHMAGASTDTVKTFTVGFPEEGYNEFEHARIVASQYGTDHTEIVLDAAQYLDHMRWLIGVKDAPLGVPNEVPLYLMSKALRASVTVVLSGEGADEALGGYGRIFRSADDYPKWRAWRAGQPVSAPLAERLQRRYGDTAFRDEVDHFLWLYRYMGLAGKSEVLHPDVAGMNLDAALDQRFRQAFEEVPAASYVNRMMYAFELLHLPGLLQRLDATTMAASVEGRVPFVDHRLVEFAFGIPVDHKLRWHPGGQANAADLLGDEISERFDTPKYVLKKSLAHRLPEGLLQRRKVGFPVPLHQWLSSPVWRDLEHQVLNGVLADRGVLNPAGVKALLDRVHDRPSHPDAMSVWMLLNLEIFCDVCGF